MTYQYECNTCGLRFRDDRLCEDFACIRPISKRGNILCGGAMRLISEDPDETVKAAGQKFDGDKPMMDLTPPLMEMEVAKVLTFGSIKYSADNWRNVPDLQARYRSAAKRHINALKRGEAFDEESGFHHAAHAVCCLMFMGEIDLEVGA